MSNQAKPPRSPEPESGVLAALAEEQEPSAEELALAEALAHALDGPPARQQAREPALGGLLETATLVKASRHFELSPERKDVVRAEVEGLFDQHARRKAPDESAARSWSLRLPLLAFGLLGALFVFRTALRAEKPAELAATQAFETTPATALADAEASVRRERPSADLLKAQADALASAATPVEAQAESAAARSKLDRELQAYRSTLIASLDERLR